MSETLEDLYTPANSNDPPNIHPGAITQIVRPPPKAPPHVSIPGIPEGVLILQSPKQDISTPNPAIIRRVEMPDLMRLQDWLAGRLHEMHPEATAAGIKGFLVNCVNANEWWFVHTEKACGLAQLVRIPLEPQPVVQDHFVFMRKDDENDIEGPEQAASIYPAMASWAAHQNASRLVIPRYTDVTQEVIAYRMKQTPRATRARFLELGRVY